jgi:hypothetical protein
VTLLNWETDEQIDLIRGGVAMQTDGVVGLQLAGTIERHYQAERHGECASDMIARLLFSASACLLENGIQSAAPMAPYQAKHTNRGRQSRRAIPYVRMTSSSQVSCSSVSECRTR